MLCRWTITLLGRAQAFTDTAVLAYEGKRQPLRPAVPHLCRNSTIGSEAAREVAEHARTFYEHKVCGRQRMGNSVYVGSTGMLKARYINCTCIYEVRT